MKQITQLIEVMLVGRGGDQAVGQATLGIDTNVGLHAKVPLIAFLGLMHLRIALLLFVLGRAGCLNDGGIHQSALGHHDACFGQPAIDGLDDAPRDKCAHFREINGIAAAFQYLQKNYNPTAPSSL